MQQPKSCLGVTMATFWRGRNETRWHHPITAKGLEETTKHHQRQPGELLGQSLQLARPLGHHDRARGQGSCRGEIPGGAFERLHQDFQGPRTQGEKSHVLVQTG